MPETEQENKTRIAVLEAMQKENSKRMDDMVRGLEKLSLKIDDIEDKIDKALKDINASSDGKYVTKQEFKPVKQLAYGAVGLILTAFVVAIMALVLK